MELPGGGRVTLESARPVTEGWSNTIAVNPRLLRCTAGDGRTVIVKMRRPPGDPRGPAGFRREMTALLLLAELGCDAGPRLLATDDSAGLLVLEDLGAGPALEDLLIGADPDAATAGFVAFAEAVGRLHTATLGQADHVGPCRFDIADHWARVAAYTDTRDAGRDVPALLETLASGPMALTNGDPAPQNCRIRDGRVRLLDFEDAAARHPLLDAAHLRLPFYGGPCWARIPEAVGGVVEAAYRKTTGRDEDRAWLEGMAAAVGAWTIVRLVRVPKLLAADAPHPMGFSRRGQMLDTLRVGAEATADVLPRLSAWFAATGKELRDRWPGLPDAQDVYPAYR